MGEIKQRDIFLFDYNPVRGKEQKGIRHRVVISSNFFNQSKTEITCPLTNKI